MKISTGAHMMQGATRLATIVAVLARHGIAGMFEKRFGQAAGYETDDPWLASTRITPRHLRLALEELGPSFIKLGQLMSTRADIFPPAWIEELIRLQDQVPPIPFPLIQRIIEHELNRPLNDIFRSIEPKAIAAASVAQVHAAVLMTGEAVAVKVIRPGIRKKIQQDIRVMAALARQFESLSESGRLVGAVNVVREFERTVFKELDMFIEAGNMSRFAQNFRKIDEIHVPEVFWDYTSRSVLVMEYVSGVKMDQVDAIRDMGIDPEDIALIGLRSFSRQLMQFGFFHADPHPGNTIVMPDGRVGLVDFGIIGYLDNAAMRQVAELFLGFAEHDYDQIVGALHRAEIIDGDLAKNSEFLADLKDACETFYGRSLKTISARDVYDQIMKLVLAWHIRLPRNILLILKTFIQTEALGKILGSSASLLEQARPFARRLVMKGYEAHKISKTIGKDFQDLYTHAREIPRWTNTILKKLSEGKQEIEIRHSGFQNLDDRLEKGINRLTIGLIVAASTIAGSLVLNSSQKIFEFTVDYLGHHTLSATGILGMTGYVIATILGLWLFISIFRSGKM
jgi:ubiquinone biosynthesis protein